MPFPDKQYTRLEALIRVWSASRDDVLYAIENGMLDCCIWMQPRYVERGTDSNGFFIAHTCEKSHGLVRLRVEDCQLLFQQGEIYAHSFMSLQIPGDILRITHEPPQPYISVTIKNLLVMKDEQRRFEAAHRVQCRYKKAKGRYRKRRDKRPELKIYNDYKEMQLGGKSYHFGPVQADIAKQLYEASRSSNPWIHGKTLLANSGSQAMRFQDVFKNKKGWRDVIESDGRGYYRLHSKTQQFEQPPADHTVKSEEATC